MTTAGTSSSGKERLAPRLSRGGDKAGGESSHPLGRRGKSGDTKNQPKQQDGLVKKRFAEQAAKMAERRKRCAGRELQFSVGRRKVL